MNTANIKKYAPLARNAFITAVTKRANELGIYHSHIAEAIVEGQIQIIEGRSVDLKLKDVREKLIKRVTSTGFNQLMEHVAYTWFNRLCAIRYMELHDYLDHGLRVLSSGEVLGARGEWGVPEILSHAQDVAEDLDLNRDDIIELKLAGNQDELLYRTLLLGQCHALHKAMPFLFESIDDETELLLPDNLTRTDSILRGLVDDVPEQDWQQVEVIGWLYQFYISEKKDEVIGKVVKSEDIPAATQLFTPNWIVKYLVQNSVGRQWLQTYPDSSIKAGMDYYIEPAEQTDEVGAALAAITPTSIEPKSIKVLDPACGSGHILVEAYYTLKAIYQERGYRNRDVPQLILENNLFGLDIDDRAAQLAGFALMMLARADDKRIFSREVQLNVMAIKSSKHLDFDNLWQKLDLNKQSKIGTTSSLFDDGQVELNDIIDNSEYQTLKTLLALFEQADTFGSLIQVPEELTISISPLLTQLKALEQNGDSLQKPTARFLIPFIQQAELLAQKYDAVVANPPYMGSKYQTSIVKKHLKDNFKGYEKDLFSVFIIRNLQLAKEQGQLGFMTPFVWMFISSYEKLRAKLIDEAIITTLIQLEYSGFDGATVPICTFTLSANHIKDYVGGYIKLSDFKGHQNQAPKTLKAIKNPDCGWFYNAKSDDFKKIPGSPIAYWVSRNFRDIFSKHKQIYECSISEGQNITAGNDEYLRLNWEVSKQKIEPAGKWSFYSKGGSYRKWFGNLDYVIDWSDDARKHYHSHSSARIIPKYLRFREGVTWTLITSSHQSFRYLPSYATFDKGGSSIFFNDTIELKKCLSFLNTKVAAYIIKSFNATLNLQVDDVRKLPLSPNLIKLDYKLIEKIINYSKNDWNTYETSWDYKTNPLVQTSFPRSCVGMQTEHDKSTVCIPTEDGGNEKTSSLVGYASRTTVTSNKDDKVRNAYPTLKDNYQYWQTHNRATIAEMQGLEQENNRLFIDAYGLQDELSPDVPLEQITLTVNPKYRYGGKLSDEILENRFQSDTLAELISYAIGCMMGRYSLDQQGLVYAHAGNQGFTELQQQDAYKTFPADKDGIIPLTDQAWFADDATHRLREFVRVVWGEENHQHNLDFIAASLCLYAIKAKSGESNLDTIRRYLAIQFYKDHLKTYKKRPIYWLFSSGKQKAFECLVYLHRYNESTLARMRTEYVTPLLGKYEASAMVLATQIQDADSTSDANRFKKSLTAVEKRRVAK